MYETGTSRGVSSQAAWSCLPYITVRRSIQSRLRELATFAGVTPMEFEMRHLWAKPTVTARDGRRGNHALFGEQRPALMGS